MKSNFSGGLVLTGIACNTELAACVIENIKQIAIFNVSLGPKILLVNYINLFPRTMLMLF